MSQPGPDPGATRKPPSWLVFADDALWVELAAGLGDEFDAWLAPRVRAALEGYRRLPPPSQA
jgi:hypothetical protein